jgi:hypothetical protein
MMVLLWNGSKLKFYNIAPGEQTFASLFRVIFNGRAKMPLFVPPEGPVL